MINPENALRIRSPPPAVLTVMTAKVGRLLIDDSLQPDDGGNEYESDESIWQAIFKALFFAFVISSVASYYGYRVKGGALEVGQASTDSVVVSSVIVLLLDVILTQILF